MLYSICLAFGTSWANLSSIYHQYFYLIPVKKIYISKKNFDELKKKKCYNHNIFITLSQ